MFSLAYCEDCVEGMKKLEDCSVDLVVTSPPYDDIRSYNGYLFDYRKTIDQLYRVVKHGGVVVWIVADQTINGSESGTSFRQALYAKECGFNLHDTMIWQKDTCSFPETVRYSQVYEYMFVFSKGKPKTVNLIKDKENKWVGNKIHGTYRNTDGTTIKRNEKWTQTVCQEKGIRFNVWEIPTEKNNVTGHPAVFPQELVKGHIASWSSEGDIVMDPFLGSGTTRIVAYDMNRSFIGFEISKKYYDAQEERFNQHISQMNLFINDDFKKLMRYDR